jgi:hypothetical protein
MITRITGWSLFLALGMTAALSPPAAGQTKDKVYRVLTPDQVGAILTDAKIKFTKSTPSGAPTDTDFDFKHNNYGILLTLRDGKMLWISSYFPETTLKKINDWNIDAKFSRAVLVSQNKKTHAVVEAQLDVAGGCTENMIRRFLESFGQEVAAFDEFLKK